MVFLYIIIAGIVGTAVMTMFMYLLTFITERVMKVTRILGTMLLFMTTASGGLSESKLAIFTGVMAHYLIGIFFAVCYLLLWDLGIGRLDFLHALLFGFVNGLAGIASWRIFFALHPNPPEIKLRLYLLTLMAAHLVFALGVFYTYKLLQL